jgi:RNA polymerase sigma factor (sigma-70 family)
MYYTTRLQPDHPAEQHRMSDEGTFMALVSNLEEVLRTAQPRLKGLARALGVRTDEIDDVVQETLLEAWRHLDYLHDPARFDAWLSGICRNICLRWRRTQATVMHRQISFSALPCADTDGEEAVCSIDLPDPAALDLVEALSRRELETLLDRALSYLPTDTRAALELHYLVGVPQREVAALLGFSSSALEVRLHRARRQLRQLLSNELRADAEAFDLVLDEQQPQGWKKTTLWCFLCGREHLLGLFTPLPDDKIDLCLRCPACSPLAGDPPLITTGGVVPLGAIRSFRPAWKRILHTASQHYAPLFETGTLTCLSCGGKAPVSEVNQHSLPAPLSNRFCLVATCVRCGERRSTLIFSLLAGVAAAQQFMSTHPGWVIEPEVLTEYLTSPALRVRLLDIASASRLTLFLHRHTLQLLASFLE